MSRNAIGGAKRRETLGSFGYFLIPFLSFRPEFVKGPPVHGSTSSPRTDYSQAHHERTTLKLTTNGLLSSSPRTDYSQARHERTTLKLATNGLLSSSPRTDYSQARHERNWLTGGREAPRNARVFRLFPDTVSVVPPRACQRAARSWFDKLTTNGLLSSSPRTDYSQARHERNWLTGGREAPRNARVFRLFPDTASVVPPRACRRAARSWFDKLTTNVIG